MFFACAVMLCGNVSFAFGVTTVVTAIANQARVGSEFEQHLDSLNAYCAAMRTLTAGVARVRTVDRLIGKTLVYSALPSRLSRSGTGHRS